MKITKKQLEQLIEAAVQKKLGESFDWRSEMKNINKLYDMFDGMAWEICKFANKDNPPDSYIEDLIDRNVKRFINEMVQLAREEAKNTPKRREKLAKAKSDAYDYDKAWAKERAERKT